ncbi:IMPACT family protein [Ekhidna sp. To15]|uniref:IMPACT family protein n=1 Tax=Ekhidna sp. To15 TaxID=3395267 RepID=UPI003F51C0A1
MSTYYTIQSSTEGLYKEKGSKFIAIAYPVSSENEVKSIQDDLRKQYYDARHHCFAWVLGMDDQTWRANDDGEPAHSAGDPILGQIRSFELTNVLVVVIRYFGGTKLGVGGLINAYRMATEEALKKAKKVAIYETKSLIMKFPYDAMSAVERLITEFEIEVIERDFQLSCEIHGHIKKDLISAFDEKTTDFYTVEFIIEE